MKARNNPPCDCGNESTTILSSAGYGPNNERIHEGYQRYMCNACLEKEDDKWIKNKINEILANNFVREKCIQLIFELIKGLEDGTYPDEKDK